VTTETLVIVMLRLSDSMDEETVLRRLKGAGDTVHAGEDLLEEGETVSLGTPLTELLPEGGEREPRSEQAPINVAAAHVSAPPSAVGGSSSARMPLTPKRVEAIAAERRRLWGTRVRARSRARTLRAGHSRCRASACRASSAAAPSSISGRRRSWRLVRRVASSSA